MVEERIGKVTHYWPRVGAAAIDLDHGKLKVGDKVRIRGHGHEFVQRVDSLQIDHAATREARAGDDLAIAVMKPVHERDEVWLLRE